MVTIDLTDDLAIAGFLAKAGLKRTKLEDLKSLVKQDDLSVLQAATDRYAESSRHKRLAAALRWRLNGLAVHDCLRLITIMASGRRVAIHRLSRRCKSPNVVKPIAKPVTLELIYAELQAIKKQLEAIAPAPGDLFN